MARITVEDCLKKIDSQYELVMLAKERTSQLNSGNPMLVPQDNDKHTVVALREIAEEHIKSEKTIQVLGNELNFTDNEMPCIREELATQLEQKTISCKDVSFKILGFSLAAINTIFSIFLSGIFIRLFINYGKN